MGNFCQGSERQQQEITIEGKLRPYQEINMHAICILEENDKSGVNGVVEIEQITNSTSRIVAKIKGLKKGKHGFHIHEFGNLTEGCKTAGSHYNPLSKTHGGPGIEEKHMGDLGNIESQGEQYEAEYNQICEVQLEGSYSVFGRSIVVHAQEDDLGKGGNEESKKTGNAGARLACGIIARSQKKQQK